jgi:hypothetical protein
MKPKLPVIVVLFALCMCAACSDDDGVTACTDPRPYRCLDGTCQACCTDDQCGAEEMCRGHECVPYCVEAGEDCSTDPANCCLGLCCDVFTNQCLPECASNDDCRNRTEIPFYKDLECKNGVCVFAPCSVDGDCEPGEACFNGNCVTIPDCSELKECVVLPGSAVTKEGTTAQLAATAYLKSGAMAPGMTFTWESDVSARAAVNAEGLITGGSETGEAVVTARVAGCAIACSAEVTNYANVTTGTRVLVVDQLSGAAVEGAVVEVGAEGPVSTSTLGVAEFSTELSPTNSADVFVYKRDYNYITLRDVKSNDLIVHIGRLFHLDFRSGAPREVAGGIRGKFDTSMIRCEEGHGCEVFFGLAGLSFPGSLTNLNFDLVFGARMLTRVELGGDSRDIAIPAGLVFCVSENCPKEFYSPTGIPGNRVAWGVGGKLDLDVLIDKVAPLLTGGGELDVTALAVNLLPLLSSNYYTAMAPNVNIAPLDKILDVDDLDDDGEITDYVPDYDSFPVLNMPMRVAFDPEIDLVVTAPQLPVGGYDAVVAIAGIFVRGAGFVPIGLGAGLDVKVEGETPNGEIEDPIRVYVSPVAGRIPEDQIQRALLVMALKIESIARMGEAVQKLAGQIIFLEKFDGYHPLDPFIAPVEGEYDPGTRDLRIDVLPEGIDYAQLTFSGSKDVNWHILGGWSAGSYHLPDPPVYGDRASQAHFVGIKLSDRAGNIGYQDLPRFNDTNLGSLMELIDAFSYTDIPNTSP